jgi:tetratricopeptide (TPR) repeat protein
MIVRSRSGATSRSYGPIAAHYELGKVLDYLGRFEEAEASVRASLRLQPKHAPAHFRLGRILYHLRRPTEAEAIFREELRFRPQSPELHKALGVALLLGRVLRRRLSGVGGW